MKRNDITGLHDKELTELSTQLQESEKELVKARLERSAGKLANPAKVKSLTHDIARIKTVIREKELAAQVAAK